MSDDDRILEKLEDLLLAVNKQFDVESEGNQVGDGCTEYFFSVADNCSSKWVQSIQDRLKKENLDKFVKINPC
jgi:hypothetical protein